MKRTASGLIAGVAGICFFLFSNHFLAPPDCASYWAWGATLAEQGNFDFSRVYERCEMPAFYVYVTPAGHISNDWPMGSGLALLPVVRFGPTAAHAWTALWAIVALLLWARFTKFGDKAHLYGGLCALVGTPLLFYLLYGPFFSHPVSFAVCTTFLVVWDKTRQDRTLYEWLLLGLLLGFAALVRPQNGFLGIVILVELAFGVVRSYRRNLQPHTGSRVGMTSPLLAACLLLAGGVVAFSPQLAVWKILYGNLLALPKLDEMHWFHPALSRTLMSDFHGIIPWTPLSLISAIGLIVIAQRDRLLATGLALALAGQIYLNAANEVWWSGGSFGNRRMADVAIITAYGMAALWEMKPTRLWKLSMTGLGGLGCFWTLWLLLAERSGNLPLDHYVPFSGPRFWDNLAMVWVDASNTASSLVAPLLSAGPGLQAVCGVALGIGILAVGLFLARLTRKSCRNVTVTLLGLCVLLLGTVCIAGFRTELPDRALTSQLGKKPGVLWDNYIELAQYEGDNDHPEAMELAARKAIAMRSTQYSGYWYLGAALFQEGRWKESADAFNEVLKLNPKHPRAAQRRDEALSNLVHGVKP